MKHAALFNGIGGFQLAAKWMGWENVLSCEIDDWCNGVTKSIFKDCIQHYDIKKTDFTIYRGRIDILSGGDPCQPHSIAGLGKGKNDLRYLWPEYFRAVQEIYPPWVVNENVGGSVTNGILDLKADDLESIGYSCQAFDIPAESVGALHKRSRIWLVAHNPDSITNNRNSGEVYSKTKEKQISKRDSLQFLSESVNLWTHNPDPDLERFKELNSSAFTKIFPEGFSRYFGFGDYPHGNHKRDEIKPGIIRMLNGLSPGMDYTDRNKRIKSLGNAIVPQVAYEIFKAIEEIENKLSN